MTGTGRDRLTNTRQALSPRSVTVAGASSTGPNAHRGTGRISPAQCKSIRSHLGRDELEAAPLAVLLALNEVSHIGVALSERLVGPGEHRSNVGHAADVSWVWARDGFQFYGLWALAL